MIPEIFQMEIGVMDTNVDLVPVTRGVTNEFWMQLPKHKNKYFTCDITVVGSKSPSSEFCCFEAKIYHLAYVIHAEPMSFYMQVFGGIHPKLYKIWI